MPRCALCILRGEPGFDQHFIALINGKPFCLGGDNMFCSCDHPINRSPDLPISQSRLAGGCGNRLITNKPSTEIIKK
jgi:hypothetical protein